MTTTLQTTPENQPGRISQLLPTVKCSTCNQPVPLAVLGDHACSTPPPVPTLAKPSSSSTQVTAPQRMQGRVAPLLSSPTVPAPSSSPLASPPPRSRDSPPRMGYPATERLKINTSTSGPSFQPSLSSPLARSAPDRKETTSPLSARPRDLFASPTSPLRSRPLQTAEPRGSVSSNHSTPTTARPSFPIGRDPPPSAKVGLPASNNNLPSRIGTPSALNGPPNGHGSRPSFNSSPSRNGSPAPNGPAFNRNLQGPNGPPPTNGFPPGHNGIPFSSNGPQGPPAGLPGPPPTNGFPPGHNGIPFGPNGPQGPPAGLPRMPPRHYTSSLPGRIHSPLQAAAVPPPGSYPLIEERDIDTKTGGEAGMAGVGRRGFAAAARAAMLAVQPARPPGPPHQHGGQLNPPRFMDIDAVPRCKFAGI